MKMALLDALAIMLGAAHFARVNGDRELIDYLDATAPPGPATVVGHGLRTTPMMAGFANGNPLRSARLPGLQPDRAYPQRCRGDSSGTGPGPNPTERRAVTCLPPCWWDSRSARAWGMPSSPLTGTPGFQITGTYNTCAAAAAAGRMLGLDEEALEAALGVSGFIMPVSHGDMIFKGHSVKPIHGGQPALCGIEAACLAKAGYRRRTTGRRSRRVITPPSAFSENPDPDLDRAVEGLGEVWATRELAFKPYPIRAADHRTGGDRARINSPTAEFRPARFARSRSAPTRPPCTFTRRQVHDRGQQLRGRPPVDSVLSCSSVDGP